MPKLKVLGGKNLIKIMEKFIKQNWFKLSIIAILLIVSLSVAYYFSIYLPNKNNNEYTFKQAEKCKSLSDDFLKEHVVKPEDSSFVFLVDSKSHFNSRLNACLLYYSQRVHLTQLLENRYIINVLTSEVLIETHLRDNKEFLEKSGITKEGQLTLSEFVKQEEKLMSE